MIQWLGKCKNVLFIMKTTCTAYQRRTVVQKVVESSKQDVQFVRHDLYHFNVSMRRHNGP